MWKSGLGWQPQHREEAEERGKGQDRDGSGAASHTRSRLIECSSPSRLTSCTTRRDASSPWPMAHLSVSTSVSASFDRPFAPLRCTCPSPSPSPSWDCACACSCSCVCARFASRVVRPYVRPPPESGVRTGEWRVASGDCDRHRHRQNQWCARAHRPKSALCMIVTSCRTDEAEIR